MTTAAISKSRVSETVLAALVRRNRAEARFERRTFYAGVSIVVFLVLISIFHPLFGLPNPNDQDLNAVLSAPSRAHLFGTDDVGRDIFSRCLAALALDLRVAVEVTAASVVIGVALGTLAGYSGGIVDTIIMRMADIVLAFPFLVLVIAIIAAFGPGLTGVYVAVPLAGWALYARFTRAELLSIRERDFVNAARTLGLSRRRIVFKHALPNSIQPAIVYSAIDVVFNIVLLASLSYLGLGVQPPTPELGSIISEGQQYILSAWWISALPGAVLVVVGTGFSLLGDGLAAKFGQSVSLGK